jgi:putative transposase
MNKNSIIKREKLDWFLSQALNLQLEVMSNHFDLMKVVINTLLECEVEQMAGEAYSRGKSYCRWGSNPGSVRSGSQKIRIEVPRVKNKASGKFSTLNLYSQLKELPAQSHEMAQSVLHGLSMRDYAKVSDQLADSIGLSAAALSDKFKQCSRQAVKDFNNRRFDDDRYIGLFIDGKSLSDQQMIIVLGIKEDGTKQVMTTVQSHTENAAVCTEMLLELIDRGLDDQDGLLIVIDGAKGIRKAVEDVFGEKAKVQRCRWHKRENVTKYLNPKDKKVFKDKLQRAYSENDYKDAKYALEVIGEELKIINMKAYDSLQEGLEETLTLQKLGINKSFKVSFGTTNCIESLNSQIAKYTRNVKRWTNSEQRYRWVISGCIEAEKRMGKITNAKNLDKLKNALKKKIKFEPENEPAISTNF